MQAIILAAGEGSRMRPLTAHVPKVMLPLAGRPILEEILKRSKEAGIKRFVIVVGYGKDAIYDHFGDGQRFGVDIEYTVQEEQLGTGHALKTAVDLADDRFLLLNGDVLIKSSDIKLLASSKGLAVAAFRTNDPQRYGVFEIDKDTHEMIAVVEKSTSPPSDMANAGIYNLDREIFDALNHVKISQRGEYELTDGLNLLARRNLNIDVIELSQWREIGRPWDLLDASLEVLSTQSAEILGYVEAKATLKGSVHVSKGALVRNGSYIEGPVYIGDGCDIGPNCYIRAGTCLGKNVRVGNAVEVKNSIVMDETKIGHLSYIGDSIIGSGCNFGAGTIAANLRHDGRNVRSYVKGALEDSGRRKLGVVMGDGVKTGIHTTIYPGAVCEPGYRSRPAATLEGHMITDR